MNQLKEPAILNEAEAAVRFTEREAMAVARRTWRRFLLKNVLIYAGTNIFFNSVIPYCSFERPEAVHLFRGTYCVARFLLPLAFFIPLLVTIDMGNKIQALFRKRVADFSLPEGFRYKPFILKHAFLNSFVTLGLTLAVMAAFQFGMPQGYTYNGLMVSIIMGIYAGMIALYFMKRTIGQFRAADVVRVAG